MTCSGESLACFEAVVEAAADATNVSVDCAGECYDAIIRGGPADFSCSGARMLSLPVGATMDCSGSLACFNANISPVGSIQLSAVEPKVAHMPLLITAT